MDSERKRLLYFFRALLIGIAGLGILAFLMGLPQYLPHIITIERFGPSKSILLWDYWASLCLLLWIILAPAFISAYYISWNKKKKKQLLMKVSNAVLPLAYKMQKDIYITCFLTSLFLSSFLSIPFLLDTPLLSYVESAGQDLRLLSQGEYETYIGSFNEIQLGYVAPIPVENAPLTVYYVHSREKETLKSHRFVCPIQLGQELGFFEYRRGANPAISTGPYEVKYLPNTGVVVDIRMLESVSDIDAKKPEALPMENEQSEASDSSDLPNSGEGAVLQDIRDFPPVRSMDNFTEQELEQDAITLTDEDHFKFDSDLVKTERVSVTAPLDGDYERTGALQHCNNYYYTVYNPGKTDSFLFSDENTMDYMDEFVMHEVFITYAGVDLFREMQSQAHGTSYPTSRWLSETEIQVGEQVYDTRTGQFRPWAYTIPEGFESGEHIKTDLENGFMLWRLRRDDEEAALYYHQFETDTWVFLMDVFYDWWGEKTLGCWLKDPNTLYLHYANAQMDLDGRGNLWRFALPGGEKTALASTFWDTSMKGFHGQYALFCTNDYRTGGSSFGAYEMGYWYNRYPAYDFDQPPTFIVYDLRNESCNLTGEGLALGFYKGYCVVFRDNSLFFLDLDQSISRRLDITDLVQEKPQGFQVDMRGTLFGAKQYFLLDDQSFDVSLPPLMES